MGSQAMCLVALSLVLAGCTQEMMNQRRVESQEATVVFTDGAASRPLPEHTVSASVSARANIAVNQRQPSRQWLDQKDETDEDGYLSGRVAGKLVNAVPPRVLENLGYRRLIDRGRDRFNISCVPCHDLTGSGNGMVPRRGLKFPPSYHTDRLRSQPLGYIFNVATQGRGQMPAYGDYLSTDDRWAISAYVRTLQFSQYVAVSELSEDDLKELERRSGEPSEVETLTIPTAEHRATLDRGSEGQSP
ncbi:MAG: cytochrome c [Planctomycetales bacterium]|nr:cytochrome c [Planctomycetales bacterium]